RLDDAKRLERLAEHGCRVRAEPLLDEGGVYAAEVGGAREVVAEHELREARRRAVHPALHRVTDDEIHLRRAVVGALARVLGHAAAELAVHVHHDIVSAADALHLAEEALDRVRAIL